MLGRQGQRTRLRSPFPLFGPSFSASFGFWGQRGTMTATLPGLFYPLPMGRAPWVALGPWVRRSPRYHDDADKHPAPC